MKIVPTLLLAAALVSLSACSEPSTSEKVKDSVNDALDRRPAEGLRDAAEDARDAAKDAAADVKEAAADAKDAAVEATDKVKQDIKDAAK
jgi:gas vesicle protein